MYNGSFGVLVNSSQHLGLLGNCVACPLLLILHHIFLFLCVLGNSFLAPGPLGYHRHACTHARTHTAALRSGSAFLLTWTLVSLSVCLLT